MPAQPPTARKALTAQNLPGLGRARIRELCQVLLVERGLRLTRAQPRADVDDLYVQAPLIWRPRTGLMRVLHRAAEATDLTDLAEVARATPLGDAVLVTTALDGDDLPADDAVQVIEADELVAKLQTSALVEWADGMPQTAMPRLALALDLSEIAPALDPIGIRWLPTLALNSVPPELEGLGTADDLFEQIAFRILTTALRMGGRRLGATKRGQRLPDALLRWNEDRPISAVLDCKAAQYGYRMSIDDFRALSEYFGQLKQEEEADGYELRYVVVISSEFEGADGDDHPYFERAKALAEEAGAQLVYLRATDLVQLVLAVERDRAQPADRHAIRFADLFDLGMPTTGQVVNLWGGR